MVIVLIVCSSFTTGFPCHPAGDIWPCTHRIHPNDIAPCNHYDYNGYKIHIYDYYPCTHFLHPGGDVYQCTHICY